jgi:hypothetical protein
VRPPRDGSFRRWGAVVAAAAVVLLLGLARLGGLMGGARAGVGVDEAARLRSLAAVDCAEHRWPLCEHKLDVARDLDPRGDEDPQVIALRRAAFAGLAATDAGRAGD